MLTSFIDEGVPEDLHLEYKQPAKKLNGKWDVNSEVVETIVSMANTADGLMIIVLRNALAHLDPEGDSINPDDFEDRAKCENAVPVLRHVTREMLRHELKLDSGSSTLFVM
jgi:hypothetical protein